MRERLLVYLAVSISTICEIVDMGLKWVEAKLRR
jgi:hypothetical protein